MQLFNPVLVISPETEFCVFLKSGPFHLQWLAEFALFFHPSLKDALWADWFSISDGITYSRKYVGDASMLNVEFEKVCRVRGDRHCSIELPAEADMGNLHSISIPAHWIADMRNLHSISIPAHCDRIMPVD